MIALYCRVSTQEQAQNGHSIDEQQDRLINYCKARGWDNYEVFVDAGFSGAKLARPALSNALNLIKTHQVDKILVYKLDRLSRSQKDTLMLIEDVFLANNCDFISISENFDTSSPLGRAMIGILAVFAQLEREQIKERMLMGHEARAKQGKYSGKWRNPIGYDYIDGELRTNEFEKMQVVEAYNLYLQGMSFVKITDLFNEKGYKTKFGKWHSGTIKRILNSRTYLGEFLFNGIWRKGSHEAFITEEMWQKVQTIREKKRDALDDYGRRSGTANTILAGYIFCGRCGARYSKKINHCRGHKYPFYQCQSRWCKKTTRCKDPNCQNKNWKIPELDNLVLGEIKKLAFDPIESVKAVPDERPAVIQKEIEKLQEKQNKLIELYTLDSIPRDTLEEKVQEISDQIEKLINDLGDIESEEKKLSQSEVLTIAKSVDAVLERGDLDEIRSIIDALIKHIDIDGENITIHWAFI